MKNKIANRPKIPVMEGEGKTGSGATCKEDGGRLEVKECSQLVPRVFPLSRTDPGDEVGSVPCLRGAVSRGNVTLTAI